MAENKFCPSCGTAVEEGTKFCPGCGSTLEVAAAAETVEAPQAETNADGFEGADQTPKGPMAGKEKYIGIGVVAVVGILVIVLIVSLFKMIFGGSAEDAVDDILTATYEDGDFDVMFDYVPEEFVDYLKEEADMDDDDWDEMLEELQEEAEEEAEDYKDYDISWEIKDTDECDEDDIEDMVDTIKDYYDIKLDIDEMVKIEVEIVMENEDGEEEEMDEEYTMIKVDGDWYSYELFSMLSFLSYY